VTIPDAATRALPLPVRINLHGSGGMEANAGDPARFGIGPGETLGTWWAGQSERLPDAPTSGRVLDALAHHRVGHLLGWDQRNHSSGTPFWQGLDRTSRVRRDRAFPAFARSSADDDPGEHVDALMFTGDAYGVINRYFEWDAAGIEDTFGRFAMSVRLDATIVPEPTNGGPPEGDGYAGTLPIHADITIRRAQRFRCLPNERVRFRIATATGAHEGEVAADPSGLVTVPDVAVPIDGALLVLERADVRPYDP
jgi:hypothetical protein